jgi:transposase-like protein
MAKPKYTKAQFDAEYPDDAACLHAIMEMRHGGTDIQCPACKKQSKFCLMAKRRGFSCQWCGHHIFPCVGTVFEKSRTPLTKWFYAMYLFTASRHGVPARKLERQLSVTYKCAWRMAHELRKLMAMADNRGARLIGPRLLLSGQRRGGASQPSRQEWSCEELQGCHPSTDGSSGSSATGTDR